MIIHQLLYRSLSLSLYLKGDAVVCYTGQTHSVAKQELDSYCFFCLYFRDIHVFVFVFVFVFVCVCVCVCVCVFQSGCKGRVAVFLKVIKKGE